MDSKQTIAIAVVAILLIAGIGVGIFFLTKDDGKLHVDGVREGVNEGDVIKVKEYIGDVYSYSTPTDNYLKQFYASEKEHGDEKYECEYNGIVYQCFKYEVDKNKRYYAIAPDEVKGIGGYFILKWESNEVPGIHETEILLQDTSMDVELSFDEQRANLEVGTYYRTITNYSEGPSVLTSKTIEKIDSVKQELKVSWFEGPEFVMNYNVVSVENNIVYLDNGEQLSKTEFRSYVSLEDWKELIVSEGRQWESIGSSTKRMNTEFGLRDVIVEKFLIKTFGITYTVTITHSENGFIYDTEGMFMWGEAYGFTHNTETSLRT